jgi:hypothetical protein
MNKTNEAVYKTNEGAFIHQSCDLVRRTGAGCCSKSVRPSTILRRGVRVFSAGVSRLKARMAELLGHMLSLETNAPRPSVAADVCVEDQQEGVSHLPRSEDPLRIDTRLLHLSGVCSLPIVGLWRVKLGMSKNHFDSSSAPHGSQTSRATMIRPHTGK